MKKRSRFLNKVLIRLRKLGLICKSKTVYPSSTRISHTVYPDEGISTIDAMVHNFLESKKIDGCLFDPIKQECDKCKCILHQFLKGGCNQNII